MPVASDSIAAQWRWLVNESFFRASYDRASADIRIRKRAMSLLTNPVVRWLFSRLGKFLPAVQQRERPIV